MQRCTKTFAMWWNEWEIQFCWEHLLSGLEVCPCCFENVISVSRWAKAMEKNCNRLFAILYFVNKAKWIEREYLHFLNKMCVIAAFAAASAERWIPYNTTPSFTFPIFYHAKLVCSASAGQDFRSPEFSEQDSDLNLQMSWYGIFLGLQLPIIFIVT